MLALSLHVDLKDAQELYQNCEFISKKTRSIYAWRAALWVRYCKEHSTDFIVNEDRLIRYLDWLFEIDLVNKINTKKSYVPDILRDHIGSIICLWRIQTGNDPDLVSPKEGSRYQAKWDEILRNYPRRERFHSRSYYPDGGKGSESYPDAPGMPPAMSPHMQSPFSNPFSADAPGYHHPYQRPQFQGHHQQMQQQQQQQQQHFQKQQQQQQASLPTLKKPYQQKQQPQLPAGLSEATELDWQLGWLQNSSWASTAARTLFTLAMSTWVDSADVVGLRLTDAYFASSTMAPRLPSSVLRLSIVTNTTPGARSGTQSLSNTASAGTRLQFSVVRSRNPLLCSWNALATMLFYRWHAAGSPPPTFADTSWHSIMVIPRYPDQRRGSSPLRSGDSGAAESGLLSVFERLNLVRDLLPGEKLPMERFIRLHSLRRLQQSKPREAGNRDAQRDGRDSSLAPLADSESPDRLYMLAIANSGYTESHHCIQRHKVIPPEHLQNTDMAVLKCAMGQLTKEFGAGTIIQNQIFNSPEFTAFCSDMQKSAAAEIRSLQQDLNVALSINEQHRNSNPNIHRFATATAAAGYGNGRQRSPEPAPTGKGVMLPPISSLGHRDSNATMGSPEDSFTPSVSPSPPLPSAQQKNAGRHSISFANSPRIPEMAPDDQAQPPKSHGASQQQAATTHQAQMSHSLPSRLLDTWTPEASDRLSPSAGPIRTDKRRRPEYAGTILPPPPSLTVGPSSPRLRASPKGLSAYHHPLRIPRSPNVQNSPTTSSLSGNSARPGAEAAGVGAPGSTSLPPISQFAQPLSATASPMQGSIPSFASGSGIQQRSESASAFGGMRRDFEAYPLSSSRKIDEQQPLADSNSLKSTPSNDDFPLTEAGQISYLREENAYLRSRLQRLESVVQQKQAEVQSWMSRVERYISRNNERTF
ncbi:hypothetical protein GGI12_000215 [Dipsacomyces acuminosporus]|nr:hypothetical protein GGI12_000215 [Dipsacomyces acuminosporus]